MHGGSRIYLASRRGNARDTSAQMSDTGVTGFRGDQHDETGSCNFMFTCIWGFESSI